MRLFEADVPCSWLAYDAMNASTGETSEAIVFFENCTQMDIIGLVDESETYVKPGAPIPREIIIKEN